MRLDRFVSETTELTRSLAKRAIMREEVWVNGEPEKRAARHVNADDEVSLNGQPLALIGLRYIMLNKPVGVECTARRGLYPRTADLIDVPQVERLNPVGRLDVETSGMILMTDDGQWLHRVTSPKKAHPKVYLATLARPLAGQDAQAAIEAFADGVELESDEEPTRPAMLELMDEYHAKLTIVEGRYHQVRRMFAAIGNHVEALHRASVGPLGLEGLAEGEWRALSEQEIASF